MSARTPDDGRDGAPAFGESRGEPCAPRWARARDALLARLSSWWWPMTDPHVRLAAGTECVGALAVVGDRLAVLDVEGAVGLRSLLDDAPGIALDCPPMTAVTGLRRRTAERPDRLATAGADRHILCMVGGFLPVRNCQWPDEKPGRSPSRAPT